MASDSHTYAHLPKTLSIDVIPIFPKSGIFKTSNSSLSVHPSWSYTTFSQMAPLYTITYSDTYGCCGLLTIHTHHSNVNITLYEVLLILYLWTWRSTKSVYMAKPTVILFNLGVHVAILIAILVLKLTETWGLHLDVKTSSPYLTSYLIFVIIR